MYAVGDVALKRDAVDGTDAFVPLAQTANRHGRLVADAIVGRPVRALPVLGTAVVGVLGLTAAVTGWSEKRARAAGRDVRVIHTHPSDHAGYYPGARSMALKLVVDVRTPTEHAAGAIPGSVLIPVDELRARHHELAGRPVVVHCAVGQRGHTAARLLTQLGHDVRNLDGGYRTWATAVRAVPVPA